MKFVYYYFRFINTPDERSENYPLHIAAEGGSESVIEELLKAGANVLAINKEGDTPVHVVARNKNNIFNVFFSSFHHE